MSSASRTKNVVITGISSRLGRLVAQRLHRLEGYHVVGLDRRPFADRPKDIALHQVDLRSKKARDIFRSGSVDALLHMGVMHKPRGKTSELYSFNVSGTAKLLEYCQTYTVPKVVVLSSATP